MELIEGDYESLKVSVVDSGIGLLEKEKKDVFNRFYQAKRGLDNSELDIEAVCTALAISSSRLYL